MATIKDLSNIGFKPTTFKEWLDGFDYGEREQVKGAIIQHPPAIVFPILSKLETNPYPFTTGALASHRKKLLGGNID